MVSILLERVMCPGKQRYLHVHRSEHARHTRTHTHTHTCTDTDIMVSSTISNATTIKQSFHHASDTFVLLSITRNECEMILKPTRQIIV